MSDGKTSVPTDHDAKVGCDPPLLVMHRGGGRCAERPLSRVL